MARTLEYYLSLDYPVEIRRVEEDLGGGYVASIPCLGSQAFVGDGGTPQEAYDNLQAAKAEILAEYIEEGLPIPEPASTHEYEDLSGKLMVRMPRELHARLAWAAKENDTSLNQFIVYALSNYESKWHTLAEMRTVFGPQSTCLLGQEAVDVRKDEYERPGAAAKPMTAGVAKYEKAA